MTREPLQTERRHGPPRVVQFSVFLDNRVGRLRELLGLFDGSAVAVAALSVVDSADFAVVRCVLAPAEEARELLRRAAVPANETELVVVELAGPDALAEVCDCLVKAEINIHHVYPLVARPHGRPALALQVDEPALAATVLLNSGFTLLGENDLLG